jgi:hypothetical protein
VKAKDLDYRFLTGTEGGRHVGCATLNPRVSAERGAAVRKEADRLACEAMGPPHARRDR